MTEHRRGLKFGHVSCVMRGAGSGVGLGGGAVLTNMCGHDCSLNQERAEQKALIQLISSHPNTGLGLKKKKKRSETQTAGLQ